MAGTVNLIGVQAPCSLNLNDFIPLTDKISHGKIANLSAVTLKMPRERSSIERCQEDAYVTVADCCDARIMDAEDNKTHFHDIEEILTRDGYNNEV